ncbi:MAG: hypothetical protein CL677_08910 [Bdellovibrionaceae bacterium]|nr:hypothetical protein [Pseudobdellovibrionaceae bacterium]|tara:strand:+ start:39427 stop:41460 length:2034 start_codon:yes stop_codon:yes gene_type:complete
MKRLNLILILISIGLMPAYGLADQAETNERIALEEFRNTVHPFLRQRCVECHGEQAEDPAGPKHTHSNPELAFPEFWRRMNVENLELSSFWRTGSNKHYCQEYNFNCDIEDQVVADLQTTLNAFATAVKDNEEYKSLEEEDDPVVTLGPSEVKTLQFDLAKDVRNQDIKIEVELGRIKTSDFYFVESISVLARAGIYHLQGVHLLIDGQAPVKSTGYENLERTLIYSNPIPDNLNHFQSQSEMFKNREVVKKPLAPYRPIIELQEGSRISIKVDNFVEMWRAPDSFCTSMSYNAPGAQNIKSFYHQPTQDSDLPKVANFGNSDDHLFQKVCSMVEAEINFRSPRRSPILSYAPEDRVSMYMKFITETWKVWREMDSPGRSWEPYVIADLLNEDSRLEYAPLRGEHLYNIAGCVNCHGADAAGGFGMKSPFGTFYSPSIVRNSQTKTIFGNGIERVTMNIGSNLNTWTFSDFKDAIRKGKNPKTHEPYYPSFPFISYGAMTDEDLEAIWNYLETLPGTNKTNKSHEMKGLAKWGGALGLKNTGLDTWRSGSMTSEELNSSKIKSARHPEGAYLANAVMHCAECHTTRNLLFQWKEDEWMKGGMELIELDGSKQKVPSIASGSKMSQWSREGLIGYLRTGQAPDGSLADGKMREVIENQSSKLTERQMNQLVDYLMNDL